MYNNVKNTTQINHKGSMRMHIKITLQLIVILVIKRITDQAVNVDESFGYH